MRAPSPAPPLNYPEAPRGPVVDDYHGVAVPDPYRWLEDTDSAETAAWIQAENALTESWLAAVPARAAIHARVEALWNYARRSTPSRRGASYFYVQNDGLQPQDVWMVSSSPLGPGRVILDPNTLSADGTVSIAGVSPSEDGRYLAYGLSDGGSDWTVWRVRDVATGEDLPDVIRWAKFTTPAWTRDGAGFFYSRYPATEDALLDVNEACALHYHALGTDQDSDPLIYSRPDQPRLSFGATLTEDGRWLVIYAFQGTDPRNRIYLKDLAQADAPVRPLIPEAEASYGLIGNEGARFLFLSNLDAPRSRVLAIEVDDPTLTRVEVVPEAPETLEGASLVGGRLLLRYLKDAHSLVRRFTLDGTPDGALTLPGLGTVWGLSGHADDPETFFLYSDYIQPAEVWRYDVATGEQQRIFSPRIDYNPELYVTEQIFIESRDGTRVPVFLSRRRDLPRDGDRPVLLYGYGGFNISLTPAFSPASLVWMELGGVYAVANLRGGGEYGEAWHEAGTGANKQRVFDDGVAVAQGLIAAGWTRRGRIAIKGGSNGGLLVGALMTQRPELFGAALPAVGVMDMLRYHRFTIGWAWASDYGVSDDPEMFPVLRAYSPLHNLVPGTAYPATLITTGDHDDRVVPGHSFKFAAALQAAQGGQAPVLIRVETRAGHGRGTPTARRIDLVADEWAFLVRALGMESALPLPGPE